MLSSRDCETNDIEIENDKVLVLSLTVEIRKAFALGFVY